MLRWTLAKVLQTAAVLLIVSVASFSLLKLAPGDPVELMLGDDYSTEVASDVDGPARPRPAVCRSNMSDWLATVRLGRLGHVLRQPDADLPVRLRRGAARHAHFVGGGAGPRPPDRRPARRALGGPEGLRLGRRGSGLLAHRHGVPELLPRHPAGLDLRRCTSVCFRPWVSSRPGRTSGAAPIHLVLPAITLSTPFMALIVRITRANLVEVLEQPYIAAARATRRAALAHHLGPWHAQRADAAGHHRRAPARRAAARRCPDRDGVLAARRRPA